MYETDIRVIKTREIDIILFILTEKSVFMETNIDHTHAGYIIFTEIDHLSKKECGSDLGKLEKSENDSNR